MGIRLVPLFENGFGQFGKNYYIASSEQFELFPKTGPNHFTSIEVLIDMGLKKKFLNKKFLKATNIKRFDELTIRDFLNEELNNDPELDWDPNSHVIPNQKWLNKIWGYILNDSLGLYESFPLLEIYNPSNPNQHKLVSLKYAKSKSLLVYSNNTKDIYIVRILTNLGIRFTKHHYTKKLEKYILNLEPYNILSIIQKYQCKEKLVNNNEAKEILCQYFFKNLILHNENKITMLEDYMPMEEIEYNMAIVEHLPYNNENLDEIKNYIEDLKIIPNKTFELYRARDLFDQNVELFKSIYEDSNRFLLINLHNSQIFKKILNEIGFKGYITPEIFVECAKDIQTNFEVYQNDSSKLEKILKSADMVSLDIYEELLKRLDNNPDKFTFGFPKDDPLFLNSINPFDSKSWVIASDLVLNIQNDINTIKKAVDPYLRKYEKLLIFAGAVSFEFPHWKPKSTENEFMSINSQQLSKSTIEFLSQGNQTPFNNVLFYVGHEKQEIYANSSIFVCVVPYFRNFFLNMSAKFEQTYDNIEPNSFKVLLKWLYGENFSKAIKNVRNNELTQVFGDLLLLSDKFELELLKELIEDNLVNYINENLNFNTFKIIKNLADELDLQDLRNYCDWFKKPMNTFSTIIDYEHVVEIATWIDEKTDIYEG
ncbi:sacsin [Gigaspora margarita]|uniref:Sacsin n=1 Tax=Gigaspora margarita TaxID=4874 RepID=A0A8H4EV83_GIGMA|nr:sacsin [Gigaspora margarita]